VCQVSSKSLKIKFPISSNRRATQQHVPKNRNYYTRPKNNKNRCNCLDTKTDTESGGLSARHVLCKHATYSRVGNWEGSQMWIFWVGHRRCKLPSPVTIALIPNNISHLKTFSFYQKNSHGALAKTHTGQGQPEKRKD